MLQDLRFAVRMLARDRLVAIVAIVALALGIGLNATVFTFVNAVLIRGLPFPQPDEIYHLNGRNTSTGHNFGISYLDFLDIADQTAAFSGVSAYRHGSFTVTESGHPPERIQGVSITANTFTLLGQPPLFGRDFADSEDAPGAEPVVLLGYGVWQSRYGGDPAILGRVIRVNGVASTVIGIMPEGMGFPNRAELWRPLAPQGDDLSRRDHRPLNVVGRLAAGVDRRPAEAEMTAIAQRLEQQYPDTNRQIGFTVQTFNERFNGGQIRVMFLALLGAVGFVLLIACANVANLLLARSASRAREVAVRYALGATRLQIVRQFLVESVLLASIGGVFGLGLAHVAVGLFDAAVADTGKPYWIVFSFDPVVFGYFAAICLTTGIVFGLAPALQVSRTNTNDVLKEGGRGTPGAVRARRLASAMVVAELTLTLVLLAGAGLMIRSFLKLYAMDLGVDTSRMLTMRLELPAQKYGTAEQRRIFYDALSNRLQTIPGLQAAALASSIPFGGTAGRTLEIESRPPAAPEQAPRTSVVVISPSYFEVLDVVVRTGRPLTDADGVPGTESVVVNERFASQFLPGEDVVGRRIRLLDGGRDAQPGPWLTIVGVAPTIRQGDLQNADPDAVVYVPYRLETLPYANILTRSHVPPASLVPLVREAVQSVDPEQPVFEVRTMNEFLARSRWPYRVFGSMFAIFAVIALVLSAVGIYAVTAYSVTQRRQEIGVRMALGAHPRQVYWLILRRALIQLSLGLGLGLALAWPTTTVLQSLVVQIPTRDPVTFSAIIGVLVLTTLTACLIPARRATRLDPLTALRSD
jgi:putative ABC transport system permease protein